MAKVIDITGQKFGRWKVLRCNGRTKTGGALWTCKCECGTIRDVDGRSLRSGLSKSCGCLSQELRSEISRHANLKHGGRNERLYAVWRSVIDRCNNKNSRHYGRYGGRGISICDEWMDYSTFRAWAMSTGYNPDAKRYECTLDRINNDEGYYPANCRWVPGKVQCNNRSNNHLITYNGITKSISEWAEETGIRKDTLRRRIVKYGWSIERALTEKPH